MKATKPYSRAEMTLPAERLETDRLLLRPFAEGDIDCMVAMDTDPEVMRHFPEHLLTEARAADYRQSLLEDLAVGRFRFFYAIELKDAPGEAVGWLLLRPTEDGEWIELGYRLLRRMWGRGIAPEGSRACLKAAFDIWRVPEVMAVIDADNDTSARVLEKLAFKPHGKLHLYDMELDCFLLESGSNSV